MSDHSEARSLPRVDRLAEAPLVVARTPSPALRVAAARAVLAEARAAVLAGASAPDEGTLERAAASWLERALSHSLVAVVNATGVILHTNLGRAPLEPASVAAALGACNLEYDLDRGERGDRRAHVEGLLVALSRSPRAPAGAEAALVVNNAAAALVLTLATVAAGREVLISRGELVEIGGSFRVPEILASAGAILREVGTTNQTRADDYARAMSDCVVAILRVHPSNFAMTGFTHRPGPEEVGAVARELGVLYLDDLGSATFGPLPPALSGADRVARALAAGADVCCFSGDKLLGGPQSGVLLGRRALVDRLSAHPLARALRPDKLALAALEHTLLAYRRGDPDAVPVARMLHAPLPALRTRARALAVAAEASGADAEVIACADAVGGGSHPDETLEGAAVALRVPSVSASRLASALRRGVPPIIAVVADGAVRLHLRTVPPDADPALAAALCAAIAACRDPGDIP